MGYKLFYFNNTALGEPIRFLLSYGKIEFEDIRIKYGDWSKVKPSMPMGQIPVLEIDGKQIHQSMSICRFLANKVGLAGKTDLENLEIDIVVDTVNDLRAKIALYHYEKDEAVKEKIFKPLTEETIPFYLGKLDGIAKENNGHLALKRLTWADFYFVGMLDYLSVMAKQDLAAKYPNLIKVNENVTALEEIRNWLAKHPRTT